MAAFNVCYAAMRRTGSPGQEPVLVYGWFGERQFICRKWPRQLASVNSTLKTAQKWDGELKIIATIPEAPVIERILEHLKPLELPARVTLRSTARARMSKSA